MKNDIVQSAQSAFAITFTSANPNEYPVIYAEDQWHTANKSDKICTLYDKLHAGSNTSATGAQFTQREINETLANSAFNDGASILGLNTIINQLKQSISKLGSEVVNVYRFKGSVDSLTELSGKSKGSRVGDVYNLKTTGMNYAFVGPAQYVIDSSGSRTDGYAIFEFAKLCSQTPQQKTLSVGRRESPRSVLCTFAATTDSTGHYLLYAYLTSEEDRTFIVLDNIINNNLYTETSKTVKYYKIDSESEMWDALGESQGLTLWEE